METVYDLFLQALNASLKNEKVTWEQEMSPEEWSSLFQLAETHHVLPMIFEAAYACPAAKSLPPQLMMSYKQRVLRAVMLQTMKTNEFLQLYACLREAGVTPLVVKGLVCRSLYPNPDYRMSGDEDLLIPAEQFELCYETMKAFGMETQESGLNAYEVPFVKQGSPLYIELHKSLFPPESDAYGDFNRYFEHVWDRAVELSAEGQTVCTLGYTDHLFYLICHAFKHFLHSGFGIRQVCDMILFANTWGKEIEWDAMLTWCKEIHADQFSAALFQIGQKYLCFDPDKAGYTESWRKIQVEEGMLLDDLLDAGIYGDSDMSRKHSSNMTLDAVAADKKGKKAGNAVLKSLFPSAKSLQGRYPYLQKHPYLLPVAWISRVLHYRAETKNSINNNAADSLKIGNQRIELLKKYGIIDS